MGIIVYLFRISRFSILFFSVLFLSGKTIFSQSVIRGKITGGDGITLPGATLYFKITDNCVGREKAAALASKSATKHKSMGLCFTANRIGIVQKSQTLESPVTINNLVNADGIAAGTEVTIKIPEIYD